MLFKEPVKYYGLHHYDAVNPSLLYPSDHMSAFLTLKRPKAVSFNSDSCATVNQLTCFCFITCGGVDGLADQTDAGGTASHHCYGVVLPTLQVKEITVGVSGIAFSVVAQIAPSINSISCGTTCWVPCNHSDSCLAVHLCREVGGNTRSWWRERDGDMWQSHSQFSLVNCKFLFHSFNTIGAK